MVPRTSVVPRLRGPEDDAASRARANRGSPEPAPAPSPPPPPFVEPERPGGGYRPPPPARYGPPPGSPRDTGPLPAANRPDNGPWGPAACAAAAAPAAAARPAEPGGQQGPQWSAAPGYAPDGRGAPPPPSGSYADRIRADDLVPARRVPPSRGWRLIVYRATFGLVNPGPGPDELRQAELEARIRSVLRGHYKVGVMGKGGVGKTTVSASIGSVFAELRQDDRVVAIDADTAFGKLGSRVDPKAQGSYWELACRSASRDVRRRAQQGGQQRRRPVRAGR